MWPPPTLCGLVWRAVGGFFCLDRDKCLKRQRLPVNELALVGCGLNKLSPSIDGYTVAVSPSLDSCVEIVTEHGRDFSDAAKLFDDAAVIHDRNVHAGCTSVNIEHVRRLELQVDMVSVQENAEKLRALAKRSGLAGDELAVACDWKGRNGPQPYLEGVRPLTYKIARKLIKGLSGRGDPPIKPKEIIDLVIEGGETGAASLLPQSELPSAKRLEMAIMAFGSVVQTFPSNEDDARIAAWLFRDTLQFLQEHPDASSDELTYYVRGIVDGSKRSRISQA